MLQKKLQGNLLGTLSVLGVWVVCLGLAAAAVPYLAAIFPGGNDPNNIGDQFWANFSLLISFVVMFFIGGIVAVVISAKVGKSIFRDEKVAGKQSATVAVGLLGIFLGWITYTQTDRAYAKPSAMLVVGVAAAVQLLLVYGANTFLVSSIDETRRKVWTPVIFAVLTILPPVALHLMAGGLLAGG